MKASVESIPVTPRAPAALKAAADTSTSQVTQTVRAGIECGGATGCVIPPLHLSSTFAFRGFADKGAYDYTRSGNPTRDLLGAALAELERGAGAVVTASGMAAVTLVGYLVPALGRIVAPHDCYGGTYRLFDAWRRRGERQVGFADFGDKGLHGQLASRRNSRRLTAAPFHSYLTLGVLRTLHARLDNHVRNAHVLAHWLQDEANVRRVWYPALAPHQGHEVAQRQERGFG